MYFAADGHMCVVYDLWGPWGYLFSLLEPYEYQTPVSSKLPNVDEA
jgi:hypothetical protein